MAESMGWQVINRVEIIFSAVFHQSSPLAVLFRFAVPLTSSGY